MQAVTGLDGPRNRGHRGPEAIVEVAPEDGPPFVIQALDLPSVDGPVGRRVALGRQAAERTFPGAGVPEVEVEEDAVGVEGKQRTWHGDDCTDGRCATLSPVRRRPLIPDAAPL